MNYFIKSILVIIFLVIPVLVIIYFGALALTTIYDVSYLGLFDKPEFLIIIAIGTVIIIMSIRLIVTPLIVKPSNFQPNVKKQNTGNIVALLIVLFMLGVFYFVADGKDVIQLIGKIAIIIIPILIINYLIKRLSK